MRSLDPVSVLDLFPEEREALLDLLGGLTDAQWQVPTACPGWSVKDVALHLLGVDVGILSRKRDGFHDPSLDSIDADLSDWNELVSFLGEINWTWIHAARCISRPLLCELLRFTGDATNAYFRGLDLSLPGETVSWAGPEPAPVWLDVAREYTERWVHQQQIRDATDQPGLKCPRWFAPVLDTFVRALPHTLRDTPAEEGTCLQLTISGDAGGTWFAVRVRGGWVLLKEVETEPAAVVSMDQEIAWRLFTRGISKDGALTTTILSGDPRLAAKVLDMVSIIA